jgi:hypothetical protein
MRPKPLGQEQAHVIWMGIRQLGKGLFSIEDLDLVITRCDIEAVQPFISAEERAIYKQMARMLLWLRGKRAKSDLEKAKWEDYKGFPGIEVGCDGCDYGGDDETNP